jgi:hypothetical protein
MFEYILFIGESRGKTFSITLEISDWPKKLTYKQMLAEFLGHSDFNIHTMEES